MVFLSSFIKRATYTFSLFTSLIFITQKAFVCVCVCVCVCTFIPLFILRGYSCSFRFPKHPKTNLFIYPSMWITNSCMQYSMTCVCVCVRVCAYVYACVCVSVAWSLHFLCLCKSSRWLFLGIEIRDNQAANHFRERLTHRSRLFSWSFAQEGEKRKKENSLFVWI